MIQISITPDLIYEPIGWTIDTNDRPPALSGEHLQHVEEGMMKVYDSQNLFMKEARETIDEATTELTEEINEISVEVKEDVEITKESMWKEMERIRKELTEYAASIGILDAYPIGSIFITTNGADPRTLFGGTWERYANGRVLVGVDENDADFTAGRTGGHKQLQSHTHVQDAHTHVQPAHTHVQNAHGHTQDAHTHTQAAHGHTQNAHGHSMSGSINSSGNVINAQSPSISGNTASFTVAISGVSVNNRAAGSLSTINAVSTGTLTRSISGNAASHTHGGGDHSHGHSISAANATATNQNTTATNNNTTATNQNTTAVNQNTTATNNNTIAVNQSTGTGNAQNLQPYITCFMWLRVA